MDTKKAIIYKPGESRSVYNWSKDTIHVKLSGKDDSMPFTVVEDNLKDNFDLPLHMHKTHTETFYVVEGEVQFVVGDQVFNGTAGTFVHVPEKIPHAVKALKPSKMIMIYNPAGFEEYLEIMGKLTEADYANKELMKLYDEKYDIIPLTPQ